MSWAQNEKRFEDASQVISGRFHFSLKIPIETARSRTTLYRMSETEEDPMEGLITNDIQYCLYRDHTHNRWAFILVPNSGSGGNLIQESFALVDQRHGSWKSWIADSRNLETTLHISLPSRRWRLRKFLFLHVFKFLLFIGSSKCAFTDCTISTSSPFNLQLS